ncbi:MAG: adenosine deaminase [Acidobacteriota bacterium]|nr:adenosine deaminase [Acidobacteriota bacterium]
MQELVAVRKVELHQHVDGSIPVDITWELMSRHGLNPVATREEMEELLVLQNREGGTLLSYLDKFHYPLWITQFYDNIALVTEAIVEAAHKQGVRLLELRYSPIIHTYAGLTVRQAISGVLHGMNVARRRLPDIECGLVVIAMRQHGPHIAKILARQAISEAYYLHNTTGVVGFDIAGAERGNPPSLFREAYDIARRGGLGLTAHAGEDEGPNCIWQAIDELGINRVGHGCSALEDRELMRRLAKDHILVECCLTSNYQTGAVTAGQRHPIYDFLEAGVPVAICTDNTTVSNTDQTRENALLLPEMDLAAITELHRRAEEHSFILAPGAARSGDQRARGKSRT